MIEGLLWFDDDAKQTLAQKVERAAQQYKQKHGRRPTICYVHSSLLTQETQEVGGIQIDSLPSILMHHFWIGEEGA